MKTLRNVAALAAIAMMGFTLGVGCGSSEGPKGVDHCCSGSLYFNCSPPSTTCPEGCQVDETKSSMCATPN